MSTLGVFLFLGIAVMAFWCLIFLGVMLPQLIIGLVLDYYFPALAEKLMGDKS